MNEQALQIYTKHVETEVTEFLKSIDEEQLNRARQLIGAAKEQQGRLHITGIGKPSHVAEYMCALFSSTGTPCYFLDGTEAVHGSAGQVLPEDVVIAISNSGNTIELQNTVEALQRMGVKIISVTGNLSSWLAKNAEAVLFAGVQNEGDDTTTPFNCCRNHCSTMPVHSFARRHSIYDGKICNVASGWCARCSST